MRCTVLWCLNLLQYDLFDPCSATLHWVCLSIFFESPVKKKRRLISYVFFAKFVLQHMNFSQVQNDTNHTVIHCVISFSFTLIYHRVFTFGIGSGGVSTELVKGIARGGNGRAEFVHEGERMQPKVCYQTLYITHAYIHYQFLVCIALYFFPMIR